MARTAAAAAPSCREGEAGVQVQQLAAAGGGGGEGGGADRQSAADCRQDRSREICYPASCHQLTVTLRLTET